MSAPDPLPILLTEANYFAGYLYGRIKSDGVITPEVWNMAVKEAEDFAERARIRDEARRETAKRNAMAQRRREAGK